jgi:hypothetical protein
MLKGSARVFPQKSLGAEIGNEIPVVATGEVVGIL